MDIEAATGGLFIPHHTQPAKKESAPFPGASPLFHAACNELCLPVSIIKIKHKGPSHARAAAVRSFSGISIPRQRPLSLSCFYLFFASRKSFSSVLRTFVINICPGACVTTSGSFAFSIAACGVTPQAQNTGISPSRISTLSP